MNISVTGFGIVCAIGNDAHAVCRSLMDGKSGVAPLHYLRSAHKELPVGEVKLSDSQMKEMLGIDQDKVVSRTTLMGAVAARQAVADANVCFAGKRVRLVTGTTVGGMDATERYYASMKENDEYLYLAAKHDCGSCTDDIIGYAHLDGAEGYTVSTACSSSVNAIIVGAEMLRNNEADIVIAGGTEALSAFHLNGFKSLMILDEKQCRPFDETRAGLNLGEGAAFIVMQRDAPDAIAYIAGYGNRCDAFHQTASSENGEGAFLAVSDALSMASLKPSDIDYINAHGTGTPNNDNSESTALKRIFGDKMPPISSTKSFTGHTTSASGAIETVICLLSMTHGFIPANLGWKNQMPGGITPSAGESGVTLNKVLCNSFGFGGNDSSLILSSSPIDVEPNSAKPEAEIIAEDVVTDAAELADLRQFVSPMESRRMGRLMKAATLTSLRALQKGGVECPDAIITATAYGMLEDSEMFLEDMVNNGEELLKPTLFMQSTHNTMGAAIAIRIKCHGYNITYSHGSRSYEMAMQDAKRLIALGKARTVLVGMHDESTPTFNGFCRRLGLPELVDLYSRSVLLCAKD